MGNNEPSVRELAVNECWALLRTENVGRLAVWVDDHPDIFPLNYAVDHGTVVFRSGRGTKVSAALSDAPVALEVDGYEAPAHEAWSVVIKGRAEGIREIDELMDTVDLPLFPWQAGAKNLFVRLVPTLVTGRRFPVVDPTIWHTPFSNVRRSPSE
ncbi:pyridoxamine 5'-phosphate oxidase family protein [Rhodococcus sp. T2V]|uniref:pyridoxamine 5'-phosphate oxidase family protein n=1 Tax=Rhodococcus sp. T2V TaxID=3034164 RepID=UPI0023E291AF|nr:pyridoxamine 5'-phosphate oxidase family protein [Rhodococcus sp. T2V]MDF3313368.1 pyridoxamine 5'-phosphate oxidase family protein [Rhodococcus sp. T2V]